MPTERFTTVRGDHRMCREAGVIKAALDLLRGVGHEVFSVGIRFKVVGIFGVGQRAESWRHASIDQDFLRVDSRDLAGKAL